MASTLVTQLSKLHLSPVSLLQKSCSQIHIQTSPLLFRAGEVLRAEPMKKKKRADPAVLAARQAKKIRRIEKEIKRLTRFGRILKPVEEIEMNAQIIALARARKRPNPVLSFEESESRALLLKEWTTYRRQKWYDEYLAYDKVYAAQQEALEELRAESEELYQAALQIDYNLVPTDFEGPKVTPPVKDYQVPDGEYADTTRKY